MHNVWLEINIHIYARNECSNETSRHAKALLAAGMSSKIAFAGSSYSDYISN